MRKLFQTYIDSVVHVHVPLKLQTGVIFFPTDITVKVFVIVTACGLIDDDNFLTTFNIVLDKTQSMMRPVVVRDQLDCPTVLCFSEDKKIMSIKSSMIVFKTRVSSNLQSFKEMPWLTA